MKNLTQDGFEIHRNVFPADEIEMLRIEADRVAAEAGAACVRNPNSRSEMFRELSVSKKIPDLLGGSQLQPVRSILFDKTPMENWPVAWHQDLTICTKAQADCEGYGPWSVKDGIPHVQPPMALLEKMITVRIHLDPTGPGNGALRVIPGSHLKKRLTQAAITELAEGEIFTCECQPGDVLVMHPLLLHSSRRSETPSRRRIIHFEYAPSNALDARLSWHEPY